MVIVYMGWWYPRLEGSVEKLMFSSVQHNCYIITG
jgi:hypothetical protein